MNLRKDILSFKSKIINLYANKWSIQNIADKYQTSHSTIHRNLIKWHIQRRSLQKYFPKIPDINNLTNKDYYWCGFMAADGCLFKGKRSKTYRIQLSLQKRDKKHLEKFCQYLNLPLSIIKFNSRTNSYSVVFCNQIIYKFYNSLWITSKKSLTYKVHPLLASNKHFWRGIIDGDGCLYSVKNYKNQIHINLVGTKDVCLKFKKYIFQYLKIKSNKIYLKKDCPSRKTYSITYSKRQYVLNISNIDIIVTSGVIQSLYLKDTYVLPL